MDIAFVGQFVTQKESILDKRISQAGNNYQLKFVELLKPKLVLSFFPIFLRNKGLFTNNQKNFIRINNQSSLPNGLNLIYRLITDTLYAYFLIKRSRIKNIFFYNIDKQNALLIWLSIKILKRRTYIVVADYANYNNISLVDKFFKFLLKNSHGVIVFNSNIKVNKVQKVLPGLLFQSEIHLKKETVQSKNVLLSGSLGKTTGLELALKTFANRPDNNLFITGRPYKYSEEEFKDLIEKYTSRFKNIKYFGLLSYTDYLEVVKKCDIALSLRNPSDLEHLYNFPSKILEYMSKSLLVISTISYLDLPNDLFFKAEFDIDSLSNTLDKIYKINSSTILTLRVKQYNYLKKNFTQNTLLKVCTELINYYR